MGASSYALDFAEALGEKFTECEVAVRPGRKFDKIVTRDYASQFWSVHAFVIRATGGLAKAASSAGPQQDKYGVAVRYDLSTQEGFAAAVQVADRFGSYLYLR